MKRLCSIMMALLLVIALAGCGNAAGKEAANGKQTESKQTEANKTEPKADAKLKAVVTILPQVEWVKAVAGDLAEVTALLPPGASPEVYQASPKEMIALEEADLYFTISVPVEVEGIIPNTATKAKIVDLAAAAAAKYPELSFGEEEDDHDHEHSHEHEHNHKEEADHNHNHKEMAEPAHNHDKEAAAEHKAESAEHAHKEETGHEHKEAVSHPQSSDHKEETEHNHAHGHKEEADHDHAHGHKEEADHNHGHGHKEEADHNHGHEHKEEAAHNHGHNHESEEEHEHHHHSGRDPHVWMSPKRVAVMVEAVRDALIAADDKNAETYRRNAEEYLQKLREIDKKLTDTLSQAKANSFIIMHPSMGYFADDYGLMQVSIEKEGKQATAEHLKAVIDYAKDNNIKVVFYQKEFDNNQAKTIASEIGGEVMELEPLASNYLENLEKLSEVFSATLK